MDLVKMIADILGSRKLSNLKSAQMFGYSSATSVARFLKGETSMNLLYEFAGRILNSDQIRLTAKERTALELAVGEQGNHLLCKKFWELLTNSPKEAEANKDFVVRDMNSKQDLSFSDLIQESKECKLELVNITNPSFMRLLLRSASETKMQVHAYYQQSNSVADALNMMESLFPVLGLPWFEADTIHLSSTEKDPGLANGSFILLHQPRKNSLIVFKDESSAWMTPLPSATAKAWHQQFFWGMKEISLHNPTSDTEDYGQYLNYCYSLEHKHDIIQLKPEFGVDQIPVSIQRAAAERGELRKLPEFPELIEFLVATQKLRYENLHSMKQDQIRFYCADAFENFGKTGRVGDQFWGFDSFTPAERKATLQDILLQMDKNEHYLLRFFKRGTHLDFNEITWYEHNGVSLLLPGTHYQLDQNNVEANFSNDSFEHFLNHAFCDWLLKEKTMTADESRQVILDIIQSL